jgi:VCBS repeat-containing protein
MSVSGQVTSTDIDGGAPSYGLATPPSNGTAVVNPDGTFTYTPNANFNGSDSFTYTVDDGNGGTDTATVIITINAVNDPPVADPLSLSTNEDTPLLGNVPVHDVDGDTLTVTLVTGVSHGTLVLNSNGSFAYTPALNYNGPDNFTYQVSDGHGGVAGGTVNITVVPVNDNPVCVVSPDVDEIWPPNHQMVPISLSGATDVDGNPVTLLVTSIFQDEPTNTVGDGNTTIDATGVGTSAPSVRAERSGTPKTPGDGRVYHINFTGSDGAGGSCTGEVTVGVPHDQGSRRTLIDNGPLYNSVTGAPAP